MPNWQPSPSPSQAACLTLTDLISLTRHFCCCHMSPTLGLGHTALRRFLPPLSLISCLPAGHSYCVSGVSCGFSLGKGQAWTTSHFVLGEILLFHPVVNDSFAGHMIQGSQCLLLARRDLKLLPWLPLLSESCVWPTAPTVE